MIREAWEEVGLVIKPQERNVIGMMHCWSTEEQIDCFLTWTGNITNCEPHKCAELVWFPLD